MVESGDWEAEGVVVDDAIVGTRLDDGTVVGVTGLLVDELGAGIMTSSMITAGPML